MTDAEQRLWWRPRGKQLLGVQFPFATGFGEWSVALAEEPFYRHKPIGNYIVDFHAPAVALVVEVDGPHHFEASQAAEDDMRTGYLEKQGLRVLRFRGCK
jgi:very-short-patch-repair endonuclease